MYAPLNGQELQRTKLLWELTFNESTIQTPSTRSNNEGNTYNLQAQLNLQLDKNGLIRPWKIFKF